jgi:hypothetical protein
MQRRLIVTHAQRNVQELPHAGDVNIYLCVTTFKRTYQLKEGLPQNVLLTWPYRSRVRWVVLDLNDGQEQEEVHVHPGQLCCANCRRASGVLQGPSAVLARELGQKHFALGRNDIDGGR